MFILSLSIPSTNAESFHNISFNFSSFHSNDQNITFQGNASILNSHIQLTHGEPLECPTDAVGRATYQQPLHLWDSSTGNVADFASQFTFVIDSHSNYSRADGLVFFLAPDGSQIPEHSEGCFLGLTNSTPNSTNSSTAFVAVEFDTFYDHATNAWDPPCDHVGIDVNSLNSVNKACVSWMDYNIFNGKTLHAQVTYNSTEMSLSVVFGDSADNSTSLYYQPLNLTEYLPEWAVFGFSASTGRFLEAHTILSWEFNSGLQIPDTPSNAMTRGHKINSWERGFILGLSFLMFLILVARFGWYYYKLQRNKNGRSVEEDDVPGIDEGFEQ
ncbi:hypothetical protein BT93_D1073 [Corymbia citriodora subsp. variegata]|nr:hypothetical protein BT93_D1073 [Corymbia citriodora subsp. variegata]